MKQMLKFSSMFNVAYSEAFSSTFIMNNHLQEKGNTKSGAERLWLFIRKIKKKYNCSTQAPATTVPGFGPGQAEQYCKLGAYMATCLDSTVMLYTVLYESSSLFSVCRFHM